MDTFAELTHYELYHNLILMEVLLILGESP